MADRCCDKHTRFIVHLFALTRVKVPGVTAKDAQEAVQKALDETDLCAALYIKSPIPGVELTEYAEDVTMALVDVGGDETFERSVWFDIRGDEIEKADAAANDSERTNTDRAHRAERAVRHYSRVPGYKGEPDYEADVADLLVDLRHFCMARGMDYDQLYERAARHFHAEARGKDP